MYFKPSIFFKLIINNLNNINLKNISLKGDAFRSMHFRAYLIPIFCD